MPRFYPARTASIVISLLGVCVNLGLFIEVFTAPLLKWFTESEWDPSGDAWRMDSVKIVWGLLSAYFGAATAVCAIGFVGIIKGIPSYVRFYRDYSIADFAFCAFFTALGTYATFRTNVRAGLCEELSRQPELMRNIGEMGLSLENCEMWVERAVVAFMGAMVVLVVIRLHFLIAVSNYYSHMSRHIRPHHLPMHSTSSASLQRIYLLPSSPSSPGFSSHKPSVTVYAPVPLSSLSPQDHARATEAWITRNGPPSAHRHHHHEETGRISLPVTKDEPLSPLPRKA